LLLNEQGAMHCPALIVGSRLVVGFHEQLLKHAVFFGNYDRMIATTVAQVDASTPLFRRLSGSLRRRAAPPPSHQSIATSNTFAPPTTTSTLSADATEEAHVE
jgi:hypothetical protein